VGLALEKNPVSVAMGVQIDGVFLQQRQQRVDLVVAPAAQVRRPTATEAQVIQLNDGARPSDAWAR
jgi:hypothetical protein